MLLTASVVRELAQSRPLLTQQAECILAIAVHLVDERVDGVELQLLAKSGHEPHLGPLAVQVAVEIEQVGLEQRNGCDS